MHGLPYDLHFVLKWLAQAQIRRLRGEVLDALVKALMVGIIDDAFDLRFQVSPRRIGCQA